MIQVTHLTKSFGAVQAVQDVSFDAPDGLITGLLGPNGAGKSTTMRLVAGVLEPNSGQTTIDGFDTHTPVSYTHLGERAVLHQHDGAYLHRVDDLRDGAARNGHSTERERDVYKRQVL